MTPPVNSESGNETNSTAGTPMAETAGASTATTAAISLPAFWPSRIELWFATAEARFDLAYPKVTQETTKFNHVLTVLSPEIAEEVADLITKPDSTEPYTKLKQAIISRTSLSESQKLKQLLSGEELGSRKPSQLLRHMRQLVKSAGYVNDTVLQELFLQQMPSTVKPILVSLNNTTLEQMAEIADRIIENTSVVAAAVARSSDDAGKSTPAPSSDPMAKLVEKLDSVLKRLDNLERSRSRERRRYSSNERSKSRGRSYSRRGRTPASGRGRVCWYHYKFGEDAKKCTQPCGYPKEDAAKEKNEPGTQ